jgi:glutathione S-transferase
MKIYGHPVSTCTRKVLCTLAEKGQPAELVVVDILKGEGHQPEHLARQPFGQVPAIDDDGFVLFESRAIIRYLDETRPGTKLTPTDAKGRAIMDQWISVEQSNFTPPAMKVIWQQYFNKLLGKPCDDAAVNEGLTGLGRALDVLEKRLAAAPFVAGEQFTLADICYMPYLEYLAATPSFSHVTDRPAVTKWWKTISARPSWQKAIGKGA